MCLSVRRGIRVCACWTTTCVLTILPARRHNFCPLGRSIYGLKPFTAKVHDDVALFEDLDDKFQEAARGDYRVLHLTCHGQTARSGRRTLDFKCANGKIVETKTLAKSVQVLCRNVSSIEQCIQDPTRPIDCVVLNGRSQRNLLQHVHSWASTCSYMHDHANMHMYPHLRLPCTRVRTLTSTHTHTQLATATILPRHFVTPTKCGVSYTGDRR